MIDAMCYSDHMRQHLRDRVKIVEFVCPYGATHAICVMPDNTIEEIPIQKIRIEETYNE